MRFLSAAGRFDSVSPFDIGNSKLVTIDAENVLTPYHIPELFDGTLETIDRIRRPGVDVAVATNNSDMAYLVELKEQLPERVKVFGGDKYPNKKVSPGMFHAIRAEYGMGDAEAIHIDDQLLSFLGAKRAGFENGLLVRPTGYSEHKGVKAGRLLDTPVRVGLLAVRFLSELHTDGIDG